MKKNILMILAVQILITNLWASTPKSKCQFDAPDTGIITQTGTYEAALYNVAHTCLERRTKILQKRENLSSEQLKERQELFLDDCVNQTICSS